MRFRLAILLGCITMICGCQSGAGPSAGTASGRALSDSQATKPYVAGPIGIDDDSDFDRPDPVTNAILSPFRAIGNGISQMFEAPIQQIRTAQGDTARKAVLKMEDKDFPDNRRYGMNRLLEFPYTKRPPYTRAYEGLARLDPDFTVRAAAIRACNRSRDRNATPIFIKGLADKNDLVRLESVKALANVPDPNAVPPLMNLANNVDENRDVRIAAVDAIKYYRTLEVARTLSGILADRDFSIGWQARRSLVYLTHKDFGYDQGAWLEYLIGPGKPLG
jgi:hypothetical protein